jgi:hypothetical protein
MSRDDWERAVARALVERAFRARLLADPADTLADYGLREDQRMIVAGIRTATLGELAARMLRASSRIWEVGFEGFAFGGEWR